MDGYNAITCPACRNVTMTRKDHGITCEHCGRLIDTARAAKPKTVSREYKYFRIVEEIPKPKTKVYSVVNKSSGGRLASIQWYAPWRRYCFFPEGDTVFSEDCMKDILGFIHEINLEA